MAALGAALSLLELEDLDEQVRGHAGRDLDRLRRLIHEQESRRDELSDHQLAVLARGVDHPSWDALPAGLLSDAQLASRRGELEVLVRQALDQRYLAGAVFPPEHHLQGAGPSQRIRRVWHYDDPAGARVETPLLDSSAAATPLPCPPLAAYSPSAIRSCRELRARGLLDVSSPVLVDRLEELLLGHPNRPWVASLLLGFRQGFWPAHSGEITPPLDKKVKRSLTSHTDEHADLIAAQVAKEVEKGWISPGFKQLPAAGGVVISPRFIVERVGSKPRIVDDHSSSRLNDGIPRSGYPTVYDTVDKLIGLHRYLEHKKVSPLRDWIEWKADVTGAFKLLPMHPLYQVRQGIQVRYRKASGGWYTRYHIQWRGAFGCRAMPYLWTSFMSALLWIAHEHMGVDYPLAYMDDAFGVDVSGSKEAATVDGIERLLPRDQARTLKLWAFLGVPYEGKKVESGRELVITGYLIRLDERDISISDESRAALLLYLKQFLDHPKRAPKLIEWQRAIGYMNWAVPMDPWARPLLTPLIAKLRTTGDRPLNPSTPRFLNLRVRAAVELFCEGLRSQGRLSFDDPGLTHWSIQDADVVVFSDACLSADGPADSSGLGFWYEMKDRGSTRRFHGYSRHKPRYRKIQFAESYALVSGVLAALDTADWLGTPVRRLLARTDSAAAVFAFDAGAGDDTEFLPLHRLITGLYSTLRSRDPPVDLLVCHVLGKANVLADVLSCAHPATLLPTIQDALSRLHPDTPRSSLPPVNIRQLAPPDWLGGYEV